MQLPYSVPDYKGTGKKEAESRMDQSYALSNMFNKKRLMYLKKAKQATEEGKYKYAEAMLTKASLSEKDAMRFGVKGIGYERSSK
jgi:intein/homing endonuclease